MRLPSAPEGRRHGGPGGDLPNPAPIPPPPEPSRRVVSLAPAVTVPPDPPRPRPVAAPSPTPQLLPETPPEPWAGPPSVAEDGPKADRPPPTAAPASAPIPPAPSAKRWRLAWPRRASPAETAAERLRGVDVATPGAPASPAARRLVLPPLLGPVGPLVEGFGLLVLLVALDAVLGLRGYAWWPVHPFALPVLYVAARHGLWPALAVSLGAAILRLGLALVHDLWTAEAWAEPLAWPVAAALVGGLVERHRRGLASAERASEAAQSDRAAIVESNDRLAARAVELEARLAARLAATTAVFEATRALGEGTEGVIRGACRLVRAATGCTACSFWLAEGGALHLVAQEGWPPGARLAQSFARGPLAEAMLDGRQSLLVTRPMDRLALGEEGILAAPVLSPWDRAVLGMVKIEDIGFADLASDTVSALEAAAGWIGGALAEARAREAAVAAAGGPAAAGIPVVAGEDASRAIAAMTALARRVGFDLALLSAEIPAGPRGTAALQAVRAAMGEAFRGSDLLLEARQEERRLSILLPGAAVAGAEVAAGRLRAMMHERAPAATAGVLVGVAWLHAAGR